MFFFLSTPEYNKVQPNIKKLRVHLRTGIAEIYENHQDLIDLLMGFSIQPQFKKDCITLVKNFPKEQAALSIVENNYAKRFEIFFGST